MTDDVKSLQQLVLTQQKHIQELERQLNWLKKEVFGTKSEKVASQNGNYTLDLFGKAPVSQNENSNVTEVKGYTKKQKVKGHGRNPFADHLEVKEEIVDISEAEKICGCCGQPKKCIGQDESKKYEAIPATVYIKKIILPKYACSTCTEEGVSQSNMPKQAIPGGNCGTSLIVHVILAKYLNHLPLERQSVDFKRQGIEIAPSTMVGWIDAFCKHLNPIYEMMKLQVLQSPYIHTDDTGIPVKINKKKGKAHKGIMWVYVGEEKNTVFEYSYSRAGKYPQRFLENYHGYLHADGYSGYDKLYNSDKIKECLCWSHARRSFFDGYRAGDKRTIRPLQLIGRLFKVERILKNKSASFDEKKQARQRISKKVLNQLQRWIKKNEMEILQNCDLGKGIKYVNKNWDALHTYMEQGFLDISNNLSERHLRKIVLGRSNWIFCGSENGAKKAALIYSFVGTCKQLDIDPYKYLNDVLEKTLIWPQGRVKELTPLNWKHSNQKNL